MNYICAHNNCINEKRAIKDFTSNKLDESIEKLEGIKYLMRICTYLTALIINDKKRDWIIN